MPMMIGGPGNGRAVENDSRRIGHPIPPVPGTGGSFDVVYYSVKRVAEPDIGDVLLCDNMMDLPAADVLSFMEVNGFVLESDEDFSGVWAGAAMGDVPKTTICHRWQWWGTPMLMSLDRPDVPQRMCVGGNVLWVPEFPKLDDDMLDAGVWICGKLGLADFELNSICMTFRKPLGKIDFLYRLGFSVLRDFMPVFEQRGEHHDVSGHPLVADIRDSFRFNAVELPQWMSDPRYAQVVSEFDLTLAQNLAVDNDWFWLPTGVFRSDS